MARDRVKASFPLLLDKTDSVQTKSQGRGSKIGLSFSQEDGEEAKRPQRPPLEGGRRPSVEG